jgi:hypothetical protein
MQCQRGAGSMTGPAPATGHRHGQVGVTPERFR